MAKKDAEEFDVEAWIASGSLPERTVTVCVNGGLVAEHELLVRELESLKGESRVGDPTKKLARQIVALEEKMLAGSRTLRVRALTSAQQAQCQVGDKELVNERWLAAATVEPVLTVDQVQRLADVIGTGQFAKWLNAAIEVSTQDVTVPFSYTASAALRTPQS